MPTDFEPFPDIEDVLRRLFIRDFAELGEPNVGVDIVDDIAARLPYVRVSRFAGSQTQLADYPVVDFETYHSKRAEAKFLCQRLSDYLLGYPRSVDVGARRVVIDRAEINATLERRPWSDTNIARFGGIVRLSVRR